MRFPLLPTGEDLKAIPPEVRATPGGMLSTIGIAYMLLGGPSVFLFGLLGAGAVQAGLSPLGRPLEVVAVLCGLLFAAGVIAGFVGSGLLIIWTWRVPRMSRRSSYEHNAWRWEAAARLSKQMLQPRSGRQ